MAFLAALGVEGGVRSALPRLNALTISSVSIPAVCNVEV